MKNLDIDQLASLFLITGILIVVAVIFQLGRCAP